MDDNRKKLIELMEDLNFPLTHEEAEEKVKGLTDEEVADLISVYSDVIEYEIAAEEFVKKHNPVAYSDLLDKREAEIKSKEDEYFDNSEREDEEENAKLDSEESGKITEVDKLVEEAEVYQEYVEGFEKDVEDALLSTESQSSPNSTNS